jgi:hypothetical protein
MAASDGFARGHFAGRVIAVLLFVAPLLLWWGLRDPGAPQQTDKIVLAELDDGRRVRVFVGRRKFEPGDALNLFGERYEDGSERFWFARTRKD